MTRSTAGPNPEHKPRRFPGIDKALAFLDRPRELHAGLSLRRMAAAADVSYVTMWKAVKQRTKIHGRRPPPSDEPAAPPEFAWQRLAKCISADLLQGRLPRTRLPIKSLRIRYSAGYRVVRQALDKLCRNGLVRREGLFYNATAGVSPSLSLEIAVLAFVPHFMSHTDPVALIAEYEQDFVRTFEVSCTAAQLGMDLLGYHYESEGLVVTDAQQKNRRTLNANYAGYVVLVYLPEAIKAELFTQLYATGKPVAIIDEIGGWELPDFAAHSKRFLVVRACPYKSAGAEVARALVTLGHKRCAFFSTFNADHWSKECLEGIAEGFRSGGKECVVVPHTIDGSLVASSPSLWSRLEKTFTALQAGYHRTRPALSRLFMRQLTPHFGDLLAQQLVYADTREQLEPLLVKASADKSNTCWIAADIDTAWFAHDFLQDRASRMPLVTFGWSPEVAKRRIAAYDFNSNAAVRGSLDFLLNPSRALPGQVGSTVYIQGTIVRRKSLTMAQSER